MVSEGFLRLDQLLLPPPGPAIVAILLVLGTLWLGITLAGTLASRTRVPMAAGGFLFVAALLAALVHALALIGAATPGALRPIGLLVIGSSLGWLRAGDRQRVSEAIRGISALFSQSPGLERWLLAASALTLALLGIAALGPPTDIDSLAYHLPVALDWLAHGYARPTPDWLHSRVVGLGESLNLLGLTMGTDCLGAVFQVAGVVAAAVALASVPSTRRGQILLFSLVAACPLLPQLALTAKPQLMASSAAAVALALFVAHRQAGFDQLNTRTLCFIFGGLSFSVAAKYSFLPVGGAAALLVLASLWRTRWFVTGLVTGLAAFAIVAAPVYLRNVLFYGDPLSPLLERFRHDADPIVLAFAWYLRSFAGGHSLSELVTLPWRLIVPGGPGDLTSVLGVGGLAALTLSRRRVANADVVLATSAVVITTAVLGQLSARFFFDAYLWTGLVAATTPWTRRTTLLSWALSAQLLIAAPMAGYAAIRLLPGALTTGARHATLASLAPDYELAQWLDSALPAASIVATDRRAMLFMPRRTIPSDFALMAELAPLSDAARRQRILSLLRDAGATVLVATLPLDNSSYSSLAAELGAPTLRSPPFPEPTRNPWNRGAPYQVGVYELRGVNPPTVSARRPPS